ncbi:beta-ketoacyl-ACP synthase III [Curtobacterium sp. Leaf261]|uniref:beta-ketoacyl-ACP synthase III n=1 Tax=Curtobacterium sp. Leaf261 TaxID=1736311 RepID=UPI0006F4B7C2|nr:beta-ketoacyl-ACP synthase III [Curtobacterium sp. Leaf261]KQO62433.1 3-oxoacyl-ACP synthase [Curtobacterium sp. Leaf261]
MSSFDPNGSRLVGLGHHRPSRVVTNDDLAELVDTSDEWIRTRTGIRERRLMTSDDTVVSMGTAAAAMALDDAGMTAAHVDLVILASMTNPERSPSAAGQIAVALGMDGPAVLDVNTACSGFEYALAIADQSIRTGSATTAMVIGSETMTPVLDWTDRSTCVLFGDGAGAAVITRSDAQDIGPVAWGSVPRLVGSVQLPPEPAKFSQEGAAILRWAMTEAKDHAMRAVSLSGHTLDDIDVLAFHQANLRIIDPLAEELGGGAKVVIRDVATSGNTSAASIPLGLSRAWHDGALPEGGLALLFGFGGGFTYAGQVVRLPSHAPRS